MNTMFAKWLRGRSCRHALTLFISLAAVTGFTSEARAEQQQTIACAERATMLAGLESKWKETLVSAGISMNGALLEIVASPAGTWTIIMTTPGGPACPMAAGKDWQIVKPVALGRNL